MTTLIRLVRLGDARALTRDALPGPYLEMGIFPSRTVEG